MNGTELLRLIWSLRLDLAERLVSLDCLLRLLLRFLLIFGGRRAFVCCHAGTFLLQSALPFLVLFSLSCALQIFLCPVPVQCRLRRVKAR